MHCTGASEAQQALAVKQTGQIMLLLEQNTELTQLTRELSERIEGLTREIHNRLVADSR